MDSDGVKPESRWPAAAAILLAIVLQLRLPEDLSVGPSYAVPILAALLLVPLLIVHPRRFIPGAHNFRELAIALIIVMNIGNVSSLGLLLHRLLNGTSLSGRRLIYAAVEIWFTAIVVYALWLWELDRGGPIARALGDTRDPDLVFPQMTDASLTTGVWQPTFIDYFYVSLTNSTAFSPTDTMPLSPRAKLIMGAQALASLATVAVVGARAVNILK